MPRRFPCPICGRTFTSCESELEHIRRDHVGRLSKASFEHLIKQGVSVEKIREFCRREGIALPAELEKQATLEAWV